MFKQFFSLVLLVLLSMGQAAAQPGNPCDTAVVAQVQSDLIAEGFDCLVGAGPFACIDDVFNYAFENCPPTFDTTGNCDPVVVAQVQTDLIAQGFDCLVGAGPFACTDDVLNYALANCPNSGGGGGNPCDPAVVAQLQADLLEQGFDCLEGAGPFACVNDVFDYAFENCPTPIDTTWGDPCDPAVVSQCQEDLIEQGFDCLEGAGPFNCLDDLLQYAFENCPTPIDTTWGDPCDPTVVSQCQQDLIGQGFDCLEGAGPFNCLDDLFEYAFENCPPFIDTTGGDPCDPAVVNQCQQDLIGQGFDCLEGAGPFNCLDDLFTFAFENCPPPIDTNGCDSAFVQEVLAGLIEQGFDCLEGAGPFACVDDVFNYAFENCPPPIDSSDCDPVLVQQTIDDMLAQGYDCLANAGPFTCVHEVVCYALDNCPLDVDTTWTDIPECLLNVPTTVTTFQQFLQYIVANCDSAVVAGIPACWLTAPTFATDDEFIQWITENCELDSLISGDGSKLASSFFGNQSAVSTQNPNELAGLTLSPNPTSSFVALRLEKGQINQVQLFDVNGRQVLSQQEINDSQLRLNLSALPSGIYMLRVENSDNAVTTRRLVKE